MPRGHEAHRVPVQGSRSAVWSRVESESMNQQNETQMTRVETSTESTEWNPNDIQIHKGPDHQWPVALGPLGPIVTTGSQVQGQLNQTDHCCAAPNSDLLEYTQTDA